MMEKYISRAQLFTLTEDYNRLVALRPKQSETKTAIKDDLSFVMKADDYFVARAVWTGAD